MESVGEESKEIFQESQQLNLENITEMTQPDRVVNESLTNH